MRLTGLHEGYCNACGGWDKAQGGRGHSAGCPDGAANSPITGPGGQPIAKPLTWKDLSNDNIYLEGGYSTASGGRVFRLDFDASEPGSFPTNAEFSAGPNFVTVESRYGYVDAWLNDEYQIWAPHRFSARKEQYDSTESAERDAKIEELKRDIAEWLSRLGTINF